MSTKGAIKACLIASMEAALDPYMAAHGFVRRARSLVFRRQYQGSTQIIDITIQIHPKDNPNAVAAVYPIMEVHVPEVDQILNDMIVNSIELLEGVTKGLSNQPIDFTSKKADLGRWFYYQSNSAPDIVQAIRFFMDRWTMPFLDIYATPQDIVAADQMADCRMVADRAHTLRVVAASLVCNRKDYALAVMEKWLGAPGTRRRYQQVFDYVNRHE